MRLSEYIKLAAQEVSDGLDASPKKRDRNSARLKVVARVDDNMTVGPNGQEITVEAKVDL